MQFYGFICCKRCICVVCVCVAPSCIWFNILAKHRTVHLMLRPIVLCPFYLTWSSFFVCVFLLWFISLLFVVMTWIIETKIWFSYYLPIYVFIVWKITLNRMESVTFTLSGLYILSQFYLYFQFKSIEIYVWHSYICDEHSRYLSMWVYITIGSVRLN